MRRICLFFAAAVLLATSVPVPSRAQQAGQPPHAWLFGTWTGGMFPTPSGLTTQACLGQPVVIFTRDVVMRATLTDQIYDQRLIETVSSNPQGAEFRLTPSADTTDTTGLLGLAAPPPPSSGFGCETADVLHVLRQSDNQIAFPGCTDFPYPLIRCSGR